MCLCVFVRFSIWKRISRRLVGGNPLARLKVSMFWEYATNQCGESNPNRQRLKARRQEVDRSQLMRCSGAQCDTLNIPLESNQHVARAVHATTFTTNNSHLVTFTSTTVSRRKQRAPSTAISNQRPQRNIRLRRCFFLNGTDSDVQMVHWWRKI